MCHLILTPWNLIQKLFLISLEGKFMLKFILYLVHCFINKFELFRCNHKLILSCQAASLMQLVILKVFSIQM